MLEVKVVGLVEYYISVKFHANIMHRFAARWLRIFSLSESSSLVAWRHQCIFATFKILCVQSMRTLLRSILSLSHHSIFKIVGGVGFGVTHCQFNMKKQFFASGNPRN